MTDKTDIDDSGNRALLSGSLHAEELNPERVAAWWRANGDEIDRAMSAYVSAVQLRLVLEFIQRALSSGETLTYADCLRQIGLRLLTKGTTITPTI